MIHDASQTLSPECSGPGTACRFGFLLPFFQYTWRPEVRHRFCWAETSVSAKQAASGESESSTVSLHFVAAGACGPVLSGLLPSAQDSRNAFHLPLDPLATGGLASVGGSIRLPCLLCETWRRKSLRQ